MTPEQNQKWQQAISPLDYLDFHALTEHGILEAEGRLRDWEVPGWAMQLRAHVITLGWKAHEPWTPNFALRSETALIGLQLQYPTRDTRADVYRRVLLRFFLEALNPIVAWVLDGDDVRRNSYLAVLQVHELCRHLLWSPDPPTSTEHHNWIQALKEALDPEGQPYLNEMYASLELAVLILNEWQHTVFSPENWQTWWSRLDRKEVASLVSNLHHHHRRLLDGKGDATAGYEAIADAYLTALEAECPSPDWMSRDS